LNVIEKMLPTKVAVVVGLALCVSLSCLPQASADGMTGDILFAQYYYPSLSQPAYSSSADLTVPETVDNFDAGGFFDLSAAANSITATFISGGQFGAATFNGIVITDTTASRFTSVTVDPATNMAGFTSSNVSFTSDQISINWPGLSFTTSTVVELDVGTTSVPEPAVIVSLLGMGLLGASSVFLRQRRVALATQG
jgi:hypothetical protein